MTIYEAKTNREMFTCVLKNFLTATVPCLRGGDMDAAIRATDVTAGTLLRLLGAETEGPVDKQLLEKVRATAQQEMANAMKEQMEMAAASDMLKNLDPDKLSRN